MNHWVMAFPYLMYLASVGTCSSSPPAGSDMLTNTTDVVVGITRIYYDSGKKLLTVTSVNLDTSYSSICLSLNILLTLMIVIRLIVHIRNIRNATKASDTGGLHTAAATVVMMLIESYALYAGVLLAYTISLAVDSWAVELFNTLTGAVQVRVVFTIRDAVLVLLSNHGHTQVIAPYLIILRVAKRRAMTNESISGTAESIRFRSQGSTDGGGSLPDGDPVNATEGNSEPAGEHVAVDENAIEEVPL